MGFFDDLGDILSYEEAEKFQPLLKLITIRQFLKAFQKYRQWNKPIDNQSIKWGEQIQGNLLQYNQNGELQFSKCDAIKQYTNLDFSLSYEYASYMFQTIPLQPYNTNSTNLDGIIKHMRHVYKTLQSYKRMPLTIPCIPFLGVRNIKNQQKIVNQITKSQFISDDHICSHPRYAYLTKGMIARRKRVTDAKVPLFMDQNTKIEQIRATNEKYDGFIHLDSLCFGGGLCALQCTFSTKNVNHARYVQDQLNVLSPIFLALTAGGPFIKGKVSDWDALWNIKSGVADDRTQEQIDKTNKKYIPDSRCSNVNLYIGNNQLNLPSYNDYDLNITQAERDVVRTEANKLNIAIDPLLVDHIANMTKKDFLFVYQKLTKSSDDDHMLFEILNGTIWNSARFKIPINDEIGWRVQLRTMEVQLTPDENAAYSLIIHLIVRVLHETSDLNLYIPITKLRQNFARAHKRDALRKEKFYFRTNILDKGQPIIEELTIHEIFFGTKNFKGVFNFVMQRIPQSVIMYEKTKVITDQIERFLRDKTTGKRLTLAQWMRQFVNKDIRYKKNSILPKQVMDDLVVTLYKISRGEIYQHNFLGIFQLQP